MLDTMNADQFTARFTAGLETMLASGEAGAFILVLANSMQDDRLREKLEPSLQQMFTRFARDGFETGNPDDKAVLDALVEGGVEELHSWERRIAGGFEIVLNPLRSLRPARMASKSRDALCEPFNDEAFNFNRSFLRREILFEDSFEKHRFRVLYNKFPFAPWHLLIAPDPDQCLSQCLGSEHHMLAWTLVEEAAESLPGFALSYNSLGAGASVNHLHMQGVLRSQAFPVEMPGWRHNGGTNAYPAECLVADSVAESLEMITDFHCREQPYNLLYRPGRLYLLPRSLEQPVSLPSWVEGVAWHEMCGVMTVADRYSFEMIDEDEIRKLLSSMSSGKR